MHYTRRSSAYPVLAGPGAEMPVSLAFQATQDTRAIVSLYKATLREPAQILVRALLECRFNFDVFVLRFLRDPNGTIRLMLDAMMLEKIRQAESSNFAGLDLIPGAPTPDDFRTREKEIRSRRSPSEVQKLKQYGFSLMSVEQRARELHHIDVYNIVYRNCSRNVHGSDYVECLSRDLELRTVPYSAYIEARDNVSLFTAAWCSLAIFDCAVKFFRLPMLRKVTSLRRRVNTPQEPRRVHSGKPKHCRRLCAGRNVPKRVDLTR